MNSPDPSASKGSSESTRERSRPGQPTSPMASDDATDDASAEIDATQLFRRQIHTVRIVGSLLQLLAVALCLEMLIGISDSIGIPLRLFFFAVVMLAIVVRLGWLTLIAIQFSLFLQEPGRGQFALEPMALFWVIVAMLTIISAMKLPHLHRKLTDFLIRISGVGETDTKRQHGPSGRAKHGSITSFAIRPLQLVLVAVLSNIILVNIPVGRQAGGWLQSSLATGQAFWPGTFWLVLIVSIFVLAREIAWRKIDRSQASLYLRSVQLIGYYRDLSRFAKERSKRLRAESEQLTGSSLPATLQAMPKVPKKITSMTRDKPDAKGSL